jgi:20S proteasome subunit beta 4
MDCCVGCVGKDFVMVAADMGVNRSIITFKHDEEKIYKIDKSKVLACSGDQASRSSFSDFIEANITLMRLMNDVELSNDACAHFIRKEIAKALRSRGPVRCNSLLAGVDSKGPALYFLDYLGSLQKVDFAAHGYCSNFALSIFDKQFHDNMSVEEARSVMIAVIATLQKRFLVHVPRFSLRIVTKDGVQEEIIDG